MDGGIIVTSTGALVSTEIVLPFNNILLRWPTEDIAGPAVKNLLNFYARSGLELSQQKALNQNFRNIVDVLVNEGAENANRYA